MKKEIPQGLLWGILAVAVLGAIAAGMFFLNGAAGNNEPSQELSRKQAEATAARYGSGDPTSQSSASSANPAALGQTGEAAAREAHRAQNPGQNNSGE
jgi:hypothetical protein